MDVAHRRLEQAERKAGGVRVGGDDPVGAVLGPVHRLDIDRGAAVELLHTLPGQSLDLLGAHGGPQAEAFGGAVDALAVQVEIRSDAVEVAGAVEHGRAQPHRMRGRADQRRIAGKPLAVDIGPGGGARGCIDCHRRCSFSWVFSCSLGALRVSRTEPIGGRCPLTILDGSISHCHGSAGGRFAPCMA